MTILLVNTSDVGGGAEKVACNLHRAYRERGQHSWLAVGCKKSDDPTILKIPNDNYRHKWARFWGMVGEFLSPLVGKVRGVGRVRRWLRMIGQPCRFIKIQLGYEDFDFPGTWQILDGLLPRRPDILHCHNLHGAYFDLRALPWLSHQVPVVLTLHDAWLLSGHCAHSFNCDRWKTGCGNCPDLTIYPSIKRDTTADNWQWKRDIYAKSRLYIATPSHWLMHKVDQSILAPAVIEARVIPNGVDLTVFHPGDQRETRAALDIPQDAKMLLFVGNTTRSNPWRDYATLELVVERVAEHMQDERIILVCLGEEGKWKRIGRVEVRFISYQKDPTMVARFYQAADIYVHPSKSDTFPNTVLEALACGTPVISTPVGGIPEQVNNNVTGFLIPLEDIKEWVSCIKKLLSNDLLRKRMGHQASKIARNKFDLTRQVDEYLSWYREILDNHRSRHMHASKIYQSSKILRRKYIFSSQLGIIIKNFLVTPPIRQEFQNKLHGKPGSFYYGLSF